MVRFATRWLVTSLLLLLFVSAFTFVLVSLIPGDAARSILGQSGSREQYLQLRQQLGLDDALPAQYWHWLHGAVQGDVGSSITSGEPVGSMLSGRIGVTLSLVASSVVVAGGLGVALGVAGALRGGWIGRAIDVLSLAGLALPSFWLGLVLVAIFAVKLGWLPATGYTPLGDSPVDWLRSLVLPAVTMGVGCAAVIAKQTRDAMRETLAKDYIFALRARGVSERSVIYRHALKNAAIPVTTVLGLVVAGLFSATVLVEQVFALPGLGSLAVQATADHDLPVIEALVLFFTAMVTTVNLLVDLAYVRLNPKVRAA
ncbi:MAG TPA: ABC transporter permease [Baekduia sp.]|uniref:ABC transporter permease n=1 Tax=Baekduia sp. TaxID=2600305 RepID=UPI002C276438|nr:ABC transporter permease [Baekduia sp.]HMJ36704.1 ABC transporter permease [Baekduia sp.]